MGKLLTKKKKKKRRRLRSSSPAVKGETDQEQTTVQPDSSLELQDCRAEKDRRRSLQQTTILQMQQQFGNAHVQRWLASQSISLKEEDKPGVNYADAKKKNKRYAASLGWETRLAEVKSEWQVLWASGNHDAFADAVKAFQETLGFKGRSADGVLGPKTWRRLRPVGEVIAEQDVSWEKSSRVCSIAIEERLKKGYKRATGKKLVPKAEKDAFRIILHSIESQFDKVDDQYRGSGAAGALVYLGAGEFVSDSDIWDGKKLKPGAAMQVWKKQSDLDRIKEGKAPLSTGTSFVFVRYVGDDKMKVLHFDEPDTMRRSHYEVWFGANLTSR